MIVSTRIQSLVSEINENEKENLFLLKKKITYIVSFSYIFCFHFPFKGNRADSQALLTCFVLCSPDVF